MVGRGRGWTAAWSPTLQAGAFPRPVSPELTVRAWISPELTMRARISPELTVRARISPKQEPLGLCPCHRTK